MATATAERKDDDAIHAYEQLLLTLPEAFVYRIGPMKYSAGHRCVYVCLRRARRAFLLVC
jgi:hypothetical protein